MQWDTNSKTCYDVEHKIYQIYVNNMKVNPQSIFNLSVRYSTDGLITAIKS